METGTEIVVAMKARVAELHQRLEEYEPLRGELAVLEAGLKAMEGKHPAESEKEKP